MSRAVVRGRPGVALRDERVDDVAAGQVRHDESERTDDEHGRRRLERLCACRSEPYGARESGEGRNVEHPGQRLQELECVLGGVELVGA